jgi:hypothetical protein
LGGREYWLCQIAGWGGLFVCLTAGGIASDPGLYRQIWMLDWLALSAAGIAASHLLRCLILGPQNRAFGWRLAIWLLPRLSLSLAAMWHAPGFSRHGA